MVHGTRPGWIRSIEQITEGAPFQDGDPRPSTMLQPIMAKMAALTKRLQIAEPIVGRGVIEMGRRQHNPHFLQRRIVAIVRPVDGLTSIIPPKLALGIEPPAIAEMMNDLAMRPAARFTTTAGAIETHHSTQLRSIDRVVPAKRRLDRHQSHILEASSLSSLPPALA